MVKDCHDDEIKEGLDWGWILSEIRSWIQTIAIVGAGAWAAYSFVYKEIQVPKTAPVNVSLNLQIQKAGIANALDQRSLSAVLVDFTATNPSSRTVYLLPNIWSAYGHKRVIRDDTTPFKDSLQSVMKADTEYYTEEYVDVDAPGELIAEGRAFQNTMLKPAETLKRSILIHFPQDKYDMIDAHLVVLTETEPNRFEITYKLTDKKYGIDFDTHLIRIDGKQKINPGDYELSGLQVTRSRAQLSLWHG